MFPLVNQKRMHLSLGILGDWLQPLQILRSRILEPLVSSSIGFGISYTILYALNLLWIT